MTICGLGLDRAFPRRPYCGGGPDRFPRPMGPATRLKPVLDSGHRVAPPGGPCHDGAVDVDVTAELLADLAQVVGAGQVLTDPQLTARYTADWMGRPSGPARAVVR
ncbi:MAG: hypothetical protein WCP28_18715, partial [Actinomycetes bacterium]